MELRFLELRRLIELWAVWYSIGVDGWLATDESTHSCTLELPNHIASNGSGSRPPYPPDTELDRLLLRALNRFGLQCIRRGALSFIHTCSGAEITRIGEPLVAMLEAEQRFFAGKRLYMYSELRRDYGDFGSHIMALEVTVQGQHALIQRASFDVNNQRRGLKLNLWDIIQHALPAYEEIYEQGAALGHSFAGGPPELDEEAFPEALLPETKGHRGQPSEISVSAPAQAAQEKGQKTAVQQAEATQQTDATQQSDAEEAGAEQPEDVSEADEEDRSRMTPVGFPFPCQSESEARHLARLSNLVAPARQAAAEGIILNSTHSLRELAALITFARYCEPAGVLSRS
jgi:hypothetical protein